MRWMEPNRLALSHPGVAKAVEGRGVKSARREVAENEAFRLNTLRLKDTNILKLNTNLVYIVGATPDVCLRST